MLARPGDDPVEAGLSGILVFAADFQLGLLHIGAVADPQDQTVGGGVAWNDPEAVDRKIALLIGADRPCAAGRPLDAPVRPVVPRAVQQAVEILLVLARDLAELGPAFRKGIDRVEQIDEPIPGQLLGLHREARRRPRFHGLRDTGVDMRVPGVEKPGEN